MNIWEKLGGRKFVVWVFTSLVWLLCIVWSFKIKEWNYLIVLTPHYFLLTGVYLGVNVWQKKIQNGKTE